MAAEKHLIVIVGPTAVGKTRLAIEVARHFDTVILSADSRQFYREMTIGTAKPTPEELNAAPHYFINCLSVKQKEAWNAGIFERKALQLLEQLFAKYDAVVLTGGSGLYVRAVCEGFDHLPPANEEARQFIRENYKAHGIEWLQAELRKRDPGYFEKLDPNNPQRMMRALEVCLVAGRPFTAFHQKQAPLRPFTVTGIGLDRPRAELHDRIHQRVDEMMAQGLVEEARQLYPYRHLNALQTVGYQELFAHLEDHYDLDRAAELTKRNTRRFARRQLTWFRKMPGLRWFHPEAQAEIFTFIRQSIEKA